MNDHQAPVVFPTLIDVSQGTADSTELPFPIMLTSSDAAPITCNTDIGVVMEQLDKDITYMEVNLVLASSNPQALLQLMNARAQLEFGRACYYARQFQKAVGFADTVYSMLEDLSPHIELVAFPTKVDLRLDWDTSAEWDTSADCEPSAA